MRTWTATHLRAYLAERVDVDPASGGLRSYKDAVRLVLRGPGGARHGTAAMRRRISETASRNVSARPESANRSAPP